MARFALRLWEFSRGQSGISGIETSIILVTFVVVATVFAGAVLTTGISSGSKSEEASQAGFDETQSTMQARGSVIASATLATPDLSSIGTGDGSTRTFHLANKPVIPGTEALYVNGETGGIWYTMDYQSGVVTFQTPPPSGASVEATYTHYTIAHITFQVAHAPGTRPINMSSGDLVATYLDKDTAETNISEGTGPTNFTLERLGNTDEDLLLEHGELFGITFNTSTYGLVQGDKFTVQLKPSSGPVVTLVRRIPNAIARKMVIH